MSAPTPPILPRLRLVLAVSLDGRLAPPEGGAAQIGGRGDRRVLEEALAWADGALLGAETLRRHGSTCLIHAPDLLAQRRREGRPDQPLALVASRGGTIPEVLPFFRQPLERWLLLASSTAGAGPTELLALSAPGSSASGVVHEGDSDALPGRADREAAPAVAGSAADAGSCCPPAQSPPSREQSAACVPGGFARVIPLQAWPPALEQLAATGLQRLAVLGGASLVASLLAANCIDELQLTLCPQLLGGEHAWLGVAAAVPPAARTGWRLLEQRRLEGEELLLRYGRTALEA